MKKDYPATQRNREPISELLKKYLTDPANLLEIGSGTGQHAVYFAKKFAHIQWHTSDLMEFHDSIKAYVEEAKLTNLHPPIKFKVGEDQFPTGSFDFVFSANTLHIMSWELDCLLFQSLGEHLKKGALVFFYGPFNYQGKFTSESNEKFEAWLQDRDQNSGIRHFEAVEKKMKAAQFDLIQDHEMPANNRLLVFQKL